MLFVVGGGLDSGVGLGATCSGPRVWHSSAPILTFPVTLDYFLGAKVSAAMAAGMCLICGRGLVWLAVQLSGQGR